MFSAAISDDVSAGAFSIFPAARLDLVGDEVGISPAIAATARIPGAPLESPVLQVEPAQKDFGVLAVDLDPLTEEGVGEQAERHSGVAYQVASLGRGLARADDDLSCAVDRAQHGRRLRAASGVIVTVTSYKSEPLTSAVTLPGWTCRSTTDPLRT